MSLWHHSDHRGDRRDCQFVQWLCLTSRYRRFWEPSLSSICFRLAPWDVWHAFWFEACADPLEFCFSGARIVRLPLGRSSRGSSYRIHSLRRSRGYFRLTADHFLLEEWLPGRNAHSHSGEWWNMQWACLNRVLRTRWTRIDQQARPFILFQAHSEIAMPSMLSQWIWWCSVVWARWLTFLISEEDQDQSLSQAAQLESGFAPSW